MLRCGDGSLYTGMTNDLEMRIEKHQAGIGAKYTRSHQPVELAWSESAATSSAAKKREAEIKKMKKVQKELLVWTKKKSKKRKSN